MNALEIRHLSKSFPGFRLNDLNLILPAGCIMGFIEKTAREKAPQLS